VDLKAQRHLQKKKSAMSSAHCRGREKIDMKIEKINKKKAKF